MIYGMGKSLRPLIIFAQPPEPTIRSRRSDIGDQLWHDLIGVKSKHHTLIFSSRSYQRGVRIAPGNFDTASELQMSTRQAAPIKVREKHHRQSWRSSAAAALCTASLPTYNTGNLRYNEAMQYLP
ncbi:hypothetical protein PGQ11_012565 [Apiospora arundinis]|uniref:Uncharacterized protein n=1 Tax=Apiospora arundinis TaxID=335852 RepID=A0ABR2I3H3_9PEZI